MDSKYKAKLNLSKWVYTIITVLAVMSVIFVMINHTYQFSESESFEKLHLQTKQIKKNINLQLLSDRENLITMSNLASELHSKGEDMDILFDSFEEMGLFENIGILFPGNILLTKAGTVNVTGLLSFVDEARFGERISGRVTDITVDGKEIVRSSVPVVSETGETIAIIYGIINLKTFEEKFIDDVTSSNAVLYVVEGVNGNIVLDTEHEEFGNVTAFSTASFKDPYSFEKLVSDFMDGTSGYTAFKNSDSAGYMYAHYAPLEFADWQIVLMQKEEDVFFGAKTTSSYLVLISGIIMFIMAAYVIFIFMYERKESKINAIASSIRKNLIEINQKNDKLYDALEQITIFTKAKGCFVIDSYGENYSYSVPSFAGKIFDENTRGEFAMKLLGYASRIRESTGAEVRVSTIVVDNKLRMEQPDFYNLLKNNGIHKISYAVVANNSSNISLLGVINPRKNNVSVLLKDVSICFSMAVYNKKHLIKTEHMAFSDALTGALNRMAYKNDVKDINFDKFTYFACVYVDVNELHFFNGHYGHAAGDQMLAFIAETLKNEFPKSRIYRMGGDEFLVFEANMPPSLLMSKLDHAQMLIEEMKYHVSVGVCYYDGAMTVEELVNEAEKLMYDNKAKYYQSKETKKMTEIAHRKMEAEFTGIEEIDACISVMSKKYLGVYCVNHETDSAVSVLTTSYFSEFLTQESCFSGAFRKYVNEIVKPEYHRALFGISDYNSIERQLKEGNSPEISYTKIDGEEIILHISINSEHINDSIDSIWIFEKR